MESWQHNHVSPSHLLRLYGGLTVATTMVTIPRGNKCWFLIRAELFVTQRHVQIDWPEEVTGRFEQARQTVLARTPVRWGTARQMSSQLVGWVWVRKESNIAAHRDCRSLQASRCRALIHSVFYVIGRRAEGSAVITAKHSRRQVSVTVSPLGEHWEPPEGKSCEKVQEIIY